MPLPSLRDDAGLLPFSLHTPVDGRGQCKDPLGDAIDVVHQLGSSLGVRVQFHGLVGSLVGQAISPPVLRGDMPPQPACSGRWGGTHLRETLRPLAAS